MKTTILSRTFLVGLLLTLGAIACKKETLDRDKFIGAYSMYETRNGVTATSPFVIDITASTEREEDIVIANFGGLGGTPIIATVDGNNLYIGEFGQRIGPYRVTNNSANGPSYLDGNTLTLSYKYEYFPEPYIYCTATGQKL